MMRILEQSDLLMRILELSTDSSALDCLLFTQPLLTGQPPQSEGTVSICLFGNNCGNIILHPYTKHILNNFIFQLLHDVEYILLPNQYLKS